MNINEQNKQEADKVVEIYSKNVLFIGSAYIEAVSCAIQDRQSVLDKVKYIYQYLGTKKHIEEEITNLTQQIEYLKSKI